jgi:hypothetical protein
MNSARSEARLAQQYRAISFGVTETGLRSASEGGR